MLAGATRHPGETLVLGIGNPLCGDDGVGARVIELLNERSRSALPPLDTRLHLVDAGLPGWGLPSWLEGWQSVFLVDAIEMGAAPGDWRCFRPEEVKLILQDQALSLHQPDLACGLALAQALDMLPEQLVLYGVQPADTTPGAGLSPSVSACLPGLIDRIMEDLGKLEHGSEANSSC
jgi:hydrogenase maturation protease